MRLSSSNNRNIAFLIPALLLLLGLVALKSFDEDVAETPEAPSFKKSTKLDLVQLTLNEKSYAKLKEKRDKAISIGTLETEDSDYVPASISFNDSSYKAEIRLKGDHLDHLEGEQWSFRVKLKDDKTILGMRKFSLHKPKTRGYLNEWLYHKAIKEQDLMGLRYNFVELGIHIKRKGAPGYTNKLVGIYAIEENFDKRTIESNKRKESVILKFSEDYWWKETKRSIEIAKDYGLHDEKFMNPNLNILYRSPISAFSLEKVMADSNMYTHFKVAKNLLEGVRQGDLTLDDAFDIKELAMQNAILNLVGARHGVAFINLRFYYNPITSKLEPIAFDGNAGTKLRNYSHVKFLRKPIDIAYLTELAKALEKVSNQKYLDQLIESNKEGLEFYQEELNSEFKEKMINIENFRENQKVLKKELENIRRQLNSLNAGRPS